MTTEQAASTPSDLEIEGLMRLQGARRSTYLLHALSHPGSTSSHMWQLRNKMGSKLVRMSPSKSTH